MADRRLPAALTILITIMVSGCSLTARQPDPVVIREPIRVEIPVATRAQPPAELLAPLSPERPVFVAPTDPRATSALTADGEKLLRRMLIDLTVRLDAWRAWATAP